MYLIYLPITLQTQQVPNSDTPWESRAENQQKTSHFLENEKFHIKTCSLPLCSIFGRKDKRHP